MAILVEPACTILGKNSNRLRTQAGFTQDEVDERAEIDRRYVQRIEAGTADSGIDVICCLRAALGTSWEEILRGLAR